jgi:hypothetical protein
MLLRSENPSARSTAERISCSPLMGPTVFSIVWMILSLKASRVWSKSGCRTVSSARTPSLSVRCFLLVSKTPMMILASDSSLGSRARVVKPSARWTAAAAMASGVGESLTRLSRAVALNLTTCLTSSGATAGLSGA